MLYVFDSSDGKLQKFEDTLFKNEQIGIGMKLFRRISLDVAKDSVARELIGNKVPQFVAFNAKGERVADATLRGYKASTTPLLRLMSKASKGHGKLTLSAFVKKYRSLLNEIDTLEKQKQAHAGKVARAGTQKSKLKKLEKQQAEIAKSQARLTALEAEVLKAAGAVGHTKAEAPVAKR